MLKDIDCEDLKLNASCYGSKINSD